MGRRLAAFLADVASAWLLATSAERNLLARAVFADVQIENRTAVAVKPRPFFEMAMCQELDDMTLRRKRRGSVRRVHSSCWCTPDRCPPSASPRGPIEAGHLPFASEAEALT
jgi:hypothetical protein